MHFQRREFLKIGAAAGLTELLGPRLYAEVVESISDSKDTIPKRPLGKTGVELSVVGVGGFAVVRESQEDSDRLCAEAIGRGVNYFDVAPSYGKEQEAEKRLGVSLAPYRDKVFIACKTQRRDKKGALAELEQSLRNLKTDHIDLYQMHAIRDVEKDVMAGVGADGCMEAFMEAKQKGMIRFMGFSSHSVEAASAAIKTGLFDTILHPTNFVCHYQGAFDQKPTELAKQHGMGRLALKAMARTRWAQGAERTYKNCWYEPLDDPLLAALGVRWTLGQGVTAAIPPADLALTRLAMNVASKVTELTADEETAMRILAQRLEPIFSYKGA